MKTLRPQLATLGSTSTPGGWKPDAQRGNRHQRGYGTAWDQLREEILERDMGTCQPGLKIGQVHEAREVDHIINKAKAKILGWTQAKIDDPTNLQAICTTCHREKTSRESRGGGA